MVLAHCAECGLWLGSSEHCLHIGKQPLGEHPDAYESAGEPVWRGRAINRADISRSDLFAAVRYSGGEFFWRERSDFFFRNEESRQRWNARFAGQKVHLHYDSHGYLSAWIFRINYLVHRLVWLFEKGEWPVLHIDHINGIRTDNRIENLRDVDPTTNARNVAFPYRGSSGVVGVRWDSRRGRWGAYTGSSRIGWFPNFEAAVAARKAYEIANGFTARHGARGQTSPGPARLCLASFHSTGINNGQ